MSGEAAVKRARKASGRLTNADRMEARGSFLAGGNRPNPLLAPTPARVRPGAGGVPQQVDGRAVEAVRESWLVEDRWWSERPLRRRYWEVVSADGRNLVVFHDLQGGGWFSQRDR